MSLPVKIENINVAGFFGNSWPDGRFSLEAFLFFPPVFYLVMINR